MVARWISKVSQFVFAYHSIILPVLFSFVTLSYGHTQVDHIHAIEQSIRLKKNDVARQLIHQQLASYKNANQSSRLIDLIYPYGRNLLADHPVHQVIDSVASLVSYIQGKTPDMQIRFDALREKRDFLMLVSMYQDALATTREMKMLLAKRKIPDKQLECRTIYEAGYLSQRLYNINDAKNFLNAAQDVFSRSDLKDKELECLINFSFVRTYYIELKLDSADIFLKRSKQKLKELSFNPFTKGYLPALLDNISAGVNAQKGNVDQAIRELKRASGMLNDVLKQDIRLKDADLAGTFQCEILDNLSIQYRLLREFKQAERLLLFSYNRKSSDFPFNERGLLISEVSLGSLYSEMFKFDEGIRILNEALKRKIISEPQNLIWTGDGYSALGSMNESLNNTAEAFKYNELADQAYEKALEGYYDNVYINFLYNTSAFQAKNGQYREAKQKIEKAVGYILKTNGSGSYLTAVAYNKEAFVHFLGKNYKEAIQYARSSEKILTKLISDGENMLDSITRANYLPFVKYVRLKSEYALNPHLTVSQLESILKELESEIRKLEDKKQIFGDHESIGVIQSESRTIYEFAQNIAKELYLETHDKKYLDKLLSIHESNIYSRIRNRLDWMKIVNYNNIPGSVLDREQKIIHDLSGVLSSEQSAAATQAALSKYRAEIEQFKSDISNKYPGYYQLKYGGLHSSVAEIQKSLPAGATAVKYILTEKETYVYVIGRQAVNFHVLDHVRLSELIKATDYFSRDLHKLSEQLNSLYRVLWEPFRDEIKTKKVIIIPDQSLYKISFESLQKRPSGTYKSMISNALIQDYVFSYDYSAALSGRNKNDVEWKNDFIGFAPGFSTEDKAKYHKATIGSPDHDEDYLKLISQPFARNLMERLTSQFGGRLFQGEASTLENFVRFAGGNKIIHIGSHAEADDNNPQLARLIFSKDPNDYLKDNSLWLKDIYSCNLSSELSVLTACETGASNSITGEGTISIGHAFSFAGSRSMLTALWKVDEQVSMEIVSLFYENIAKGMDKDEALHNAKLKFLETADDWRSAPASWAGLILMGDTSPIELERKKSAIFYLALIGILSLAILSVGFVYLRKRNSFGQDIA